MVAQAEAAGSVVEEVVIVEEEAEKAAWRSRGSFPPPWLVELIERLDPLLA